MIDCAIVDDHCDIVPFILACIRSKKIKIINDDISNSNTINGNDVVFVHLDSHPDFSLPSKNDISDGYNVKEWSKSDNLQNILNSEGGIAEFIIPMVYNKHISKVIWIKPEWSQQFECGYYNFNIGNNINTKKAALTLKHHYYIGESIICNEKHLEKETVKPVHFYVSSDDIDDNENNIFKYIDGDHQICWILDLCLDYFSTYNPFYEEISKNIRQDIEKLKCCSVLLSSENVVIISYEFDTDINYQKSGNNIIMIIRNFFDSLRHVNLQLEDYQDNIEYADLIKQTMDNILGDYTNTTEKLLSFIPYHYSQNLHNFEEILKLLSNQSKMDIVRIGTLILLPHHLSTNEEVEIILNRVRVFILSYCDRFKSFPVVITIARSSDDDEYTPRDQVDIIQKKLVILLQELFAPKQIALHDLCDDSWNTSYSLFLNDKIKDMIKRQKTRP